MRQEQQTEIVIRPRRGWIGLDLRGLWAFRDLLYVLTWRIIKVKYKQTLLGFGWVILRPVVLMVIFSLLFGRFGKFPSEGAPYPVFVYLGLLPWTYFQTALSQSSNSLVGSGQLISKVYFPRMLIPLSTALAELLDLFVSMSVLVLIMFHYRIVPEAGILLMPGLVCVIFLTVLGPALLLSALGVKYRDVGYILPFAVQTWMFLTPVVYPVTFIPEQFHMVMYLNPMAGAVEAFRACVLADVNVNVQGLMMSGGMSLILFVSGIAYFNRVERSFADVI